MVWREILSNASWLADAQRLVVEAWTEASRYRKTPHHKEKKLYNAITDKVNGVLPWIMNHW
jgi:hypothetical protein